MDLKGRVLCISYPKTPGDAVHIPQYVEVPGVVGQASLEMLIHAINENTSLIAHMMVPADTKNQSGNKRKH
jgi:hypothetical protein